MDKWSEEQEAIFAEVENVAQKGNIFVDAAPGSGKTSTIVEAAKRVLRKDCAKRVALVAFNTGIVGELKGRLEGFPCDIMTLHGMGLRALQAEKRRIVEKRKYAEICQEYFTGLGISGGGARLWKLSEAFGKALEVRRVQFPGGEEGVWEKVRDFLGEEYEEVWQDFDLGGAGEKLLRIGEDRSGIVDFADMLYLPARGQGSWGKMDWEYIFVDEAQDLSAAGREMLKQGLLAQRVGETGSARAASRFIFVGDARQSIYGFAGADTRSVDRVKDLWNCREMRLSCSWRCSRDIVEFANQVFPGRGGFYAREGAPQGEVAAVEYWQMLGNAREGDLILCRTFAPLLKAGFDFLREGRKVCLRGEDMLAKLQKYASAAGAEGKDLAEAEISIGRWVAQKYAGVPEGKTISGYWSEIGDILLVMARYGWDWEGIFGAGGQAITLLTVHKAKGLESERVWILRPDLMPFYRAVSEEEVEQEKNILFVARSRAKSGLYLVREG